MPSFRGKPACSCLAESLPWVEKVMLHEELIKFNLDVYQIIGGASASAGTHRTGGAVDTGQFSDAQLRVWRDMGYDAAWHRRESQGFDIDHCHAVARGCPHNGPARYQIDAVDDGYNGLGNGGRDGRDDGPRPLSGRTWEEGIAWAKALLAEKPAPAPTGILTVHLSDPRITEASGLAHSALYPNIAYVMNDEAGPIFVIDTRTGRTVGTFTLKGVKLVDPESIAVRSDGSLWLADIGDNNAERKSTALYVLQEPGPSAHGELVAEKYVIAYPDGRRNSETLLINPVTKNRYIVSKEASGNLYRSKVGALQPGRVNVLEHVGSKLPAYVTDAVFTPDARFVLLRQKGHVDTVTVLDGETWRFAGLIRVPAVAQPESITMAPDGLSFYIGSEGKNSPLIRVPLPAKYRPGHPAPASHPIDTSIWKWTGPTPLGGDHPVEKYPIGSFEDAPWFARGADRLTFRAPADGAHTPGSMFSRSELREMTRGGKRAAWSNASGVHTMEIEQAITHLPDGKPHVVAGQIHDADDDVIMIRLEGSRLFVESGGREVALLDASYRLGDRFHVKIVAAPGGVWVAYNHGKGQKVHSGTFSDAYFKAGCYTQASSRVPKSNPKYGIGYGEVVIYRLEVSHT